MPYDKEQIKRLFLQNRLAETEEMLSHAQADDAWALYMSGRIAWKEGRKTDAISLYTKAAAIDPASEAAVALEQARQVMDFFNKDLLNP